MNDIYPFNSPIILNDNIFVEYGGITGSSTAAMRQVAYTVAEEYATDDIGTFLLPVIVTGTYSYSLINPIILDYGYINSVKEIRFLDIQERIYYTVSGTANTFVSLRDATYGIVDIHSLFANCGCVSSFNPHPYQVQVVYEPGLPTGTANNPRPLLGLVQAADMVLNQIEGFGNEADGLVGVEAFKNQDYFEKRHALKNTVFGSSARAQFVSGLFSRLRKHRFVKLGK